MSEDKFEAIPCEESKDDFNVLDHIVTDKITFGIKLKFLCFMEWLWGVRHKHCMFCKHFTPFHGSAGICERKIGCLNVDMRDCFDTCDRKAFNAVSPFGK